MIKIEGTPDSFYSIYQFKMNFSGLSSGNHTLIVYALDYNGYYYYANYYKYYYYLKSFETYFWVGLPIKAQLSLFSVSGISLKDAFVRFCSIGAIYSNYTNNSGITNVYLFSGTYSVEIYWNGKNLSNNMQIYENISNESINNNILNISKSISLKIYADVGNPILRILDSENMPVFNALVYVVFQNENKLLFNSNLTGFVNLGLNPGGNYRITVYYENVMVGNDSLNFTFNRTNTFEILNVNVNIYHVLFQVIDSLGYDVQNAKLYMLSQYGVESFNSTNSSGFTALIVPNGFYSITITWLNVDVNASYISVNNNSFVQVKAKIFYLNLSLVDGENKALNNAYFSINGNGITMLKEENINTTSFLLPIGAYNISTFWEGSIVNSTIINLSQNLNLKINASVYYLSIQVYDNNKNLLNGTEILVEHNGSVVAYSPKPSAVFRIPKGNYTIFVKFNTEYYLTPISLSYEKNITLDNNKNYTLKMNYPPFIFSTYLFYIILTFIVLIVVFLLAIRTRKK